MPAVSERQRRAMWAAAEGRSNLGIPKSVGEEFVRGDSSKKPDLGDLSDFEAAEAIRDGELPSPTKYRDFWLFDLRITGTGAAYRQKLKEYAFRDPETWLSDEFLTRCNGLPVIFDHPKGSLNHEEFRDRSLGSIVLPYKKGDEVWGIAKIFDADAAELMQTSHRSTSPGITGDEGSKRVTLENGTKVLREDLPLVLDHLAICEVGVWDKNGPPEGVRLDSVPAKERNVTEEERKKLEEERDSEKRRADAAETELKTMREDKVRRDSEEKTRKDSEEEEHKKKEREDKARKDAEETERQAIERAEKEKADKKRKDRKDRHDSEKHEGQHEDCARCDSQEEKGETDSRKDAAAKTENVDADEFQKIKDKQIHDSQTIASLQKELAEMRRQPTVDEGNALAAAYHRADSVFQMLGEQTPRPMPGESSLAYRRRVAEPLRKHSDRFKNEAINDSVTGAAFDIVESVIYDEALKAAKNPVINDSNKDRLLERTTTANGKTRTEFFGSSRVGFAPFMAPIMSFKLRNPSAIGGSRG